MYSFNDVFVTGPGIDSNICTALPCQFQTLVPRINTNNFQTLCFCKLYSEMTKTTSAAYNGYPFPPFAQQTK
jgi:hypothetical protein